MKICIVSVGGISWRNYPVRSRDTPADPAMAKPLWVWTRNGQPAVPAGVGWDLPP